ncbi:MAG: hypothetical protein HYS12_05340 [Planctomycetes bacterium]|nr:hypothetical protein [Planctomycetota bacterium]
MRATMTVLLTAFVLSFFAPRLAQGGSPLDFQPDPKSVRRSGPAYRYPQAGWIVLHIEGKPYERGFQHGQLLAAEVLAYLRCSAAIQSAKDPVAGWKHTRSLVNALFVRRYEKEYLEEMKGIADGATAAGARFDNRPLDLVDIVALNAWAEIETLDSALEATPTGLEGLRFPRPQPRAMPAAKPMHCSAFAATGPATADGKIVFGHITMFGLYPSHHYNVWLDVQPDKGHRVLMQSYPGGIQSGMDYYMNSAGLLVCETTIRQTRFDIQGMTVASRIRKALQYADSIDGAVAILKKDNNGLYTNEWLLADIKTNEVAMFELGTHKSKLYRSSKNEWFGGTEGIYWGCNNVKDLQVRLETIPGVEGRPANLVWHPSDRDKTWLRLINKYKGKIDAHFGKEAFTTPPVAAYPSLDAKYTTTDMAKELKTVALFGPPLGRSWQPTQEERQNFPDIRPLVGNPWTVLHANAPPRVKWNGPAVVDLPYKVEAVAEKTAPAIEDEPLPTVPAWHGTILPRTDADIWLATAFAHYEKIVAAENALRDRASDGKLSAADRDRLALELFAHRVNYLAGARASVDQPLAKTKPETVGDDWYRVAAGKGVWVLHELRKVLGDRTFEKAMDSFGRLHAGKEVTSAQFQLHVEQVAKKRLDEFFAYWLKQPGLPALQLGPFSFLRNNNPGGGYHVGGEICRPDKLPPLVVAVTVETDKGEVTKEVVLDGPTTKVLMETPDRPRRVIVDKYGGAARANGGPFSVFSFHAELEQSLIVYGTQNETAANRETAEALQRAILQKWSNVTVPIKSDKDVTGADLKAHHLLLIGRPDGNALVQRFREALPIHFGSRSFTVRQETFAHPGSAVIVAGENPVNKRFSMVVLAGLSADSTSRTPDALFKHSDRHGEVLLLPNGVQPRSLVMPARELVRELDEPTAKGKQ